VYEVRVAQEDVGVVIGRSGRTINAIRTLLRGVPDAPERVWVELIEEGRPRPAVSSSEADQAGEGREDREFDAEGDRGPRWEDDQEHGHGHGHDDEQHHEHEQESAPDHDDDRDRDRDRNRDHDRDGETPAPGEGR
jgi:hypothetical protein